MGKMANILIIDFIWAFLNGLLLPTTHVAVGVSIIAWFVFAFIAIAILYQDMIDMEAKKRTVVTPITSFDQKSSIGAAFIIIGVIGVVGFVIGYTITPL